MEIKRKKHRVLINKTVLPNIVLISFKLNATFDETAKFCEYTLFSFTFNGLRKHIVHAFRRQLNINHLKIIIMSQKLATTMKINN